MTIVSEVTVRFHPAIEVSLIVCLMLAIVCLLRQGYR